MPLPPALAAKLSKRGILSVKQKQTVEKKIDYKGLSTCPNKNNIYHECSHWCEIHWKGVPTPDPKYLRNMQKLLVKYPLPMNWTEIFDKGVGRYYYWNMENDLVSWLPPKHPKSVPTPSAAKLREKRIKEEREEKTGKDKEKKDIREISKDHEREKETERESDEEDRGHRLRYSDRDRRDRNRDRERDRDRESREDRRRDRDRDRRDDRYRKRAKRDDIIDPMDPAAYSDIPQGTWSDGLENNKTRADNTASGVLYQQRPYPAPGEVLAANKEKIKKK